jgi:quinolinate synthase
MDSGQYHFIKSLKMKSNSLLVEEIKKLKRQRDAVILAHVYQRGEVQDIADFVGDSLDLSRKAVEVESRVIVFCGVQFMAETAAILNPDKTVLIPDKKANCGLADTATVAHLEKISKQHPDACKVSYINCTAAIKANSDICCTSANAVKVANTVPDDQILFIPDRNLGAYVTEKTHKEILPWDGYCYVHENIKIDHILSLKLKHPCSEIIAHPECTREIRFAANYVGSTAQMSRYVTQSFNREFIVATESNFAYRLEKDNPGKKFYPVDTICEGMNVITLEKVRDSLKRLEHIVRIPDKIRNKAKLSLDLMLGI